MSVCKECGQEEKTCCQSALTKQKQEFIEILEGLRKYVDDNGLVQTTYSNVCWDDGDLMVKRTDTEAQGDWSQEDWDEEVMKDFKPEFLNFDGVMTKIDKAISKLKEVDG